MVLSFNGFQLGAKPAPAPLVASGAHISNAHTVFGEAIVPLDWARCKVGTKV